ncbi:uncharacterized protein LOC111711578 [Eurytemora carolleeae]|uniref:uncharacterized protein LOC111711578 n=1 Tax=Eurytemora carolleeae TaxID=1294199 RepID=UPI000C778B11|nr:uncharacterized protein LOC111711578 [Eurytemora carolleeae]|eukprot:XP_023341733.1 uncharacterized protein LOC111711578 [Eurytemora affinis]
MPSFGYKRRYLSEGLFPKIRRNYEQVLTLFCILFSLSILLILVITGVDLGLSIPIASYSIMEGKAGEKGGKGEETEKKREEEDIEFYLVKTIKAITIIYIIAQVLSLFLRILYISFPSISRNNTYVLTLAVLETEGRLVTMYGSTAATDENISCQDICIFYHRVTGGNCHSFCEPLSLPLPGLHLPIQVFCLLLSLLLVCLESALLDIDNFYTATTVISVLNSVQQLLLTLCTYALTTDTGFCCFGISITRWFIHTDVYTQTLESLVKESFTSPNKHENEEWFRSTLVQEPENQMDASRAGQVKMLQHFLETWHEQLYREVYVGQDAVSLFITKNEKDRLDEFYTRRILSYDSDEKVIFQRK